MIATPDYAALLRTAIDEARAGLAEGGIPIGAALYHGDGRLLGCGHNRRVQEGDPSVHGETDAFRKAGRQRGYRDTIMVTRWPRAGTAPGWYASSTSAPWWSANRRPSPAASAGCARTASTSST